MALGLLEQIHSWQFHHGLDMLEAAYRASRLDPDNTKARLRGEYDGVLAEDGKDDSCGGHEDHLVALRDEADVVLKLIREAFAISLYHYWEKQAPRWTGEKRYDANRIPKALIARGLTPDVSGLDVLRLAANVAKHSRGASARALFNRRPDLFRGPTPPGAPQIAYAEAETAPAYEPCYDDLILTDAFLKRMFYVVRSSGPARVQLGA